MYNIKRTKQEYPKVINARWNVLRTILFGSTFLACFTFFSPLEAGRPSKVNICHYNKNSDNYKFLSISENAVDSHIENHGDTFPDSSGLDALCLPTGAKVFARAYIDMLDDGEPYVPSEDVIIAEWVDANMNDVPDGGDLIIHGVYPKSFTDLSDQIPALTRDSSIESLKTANATSLIGIIGTYEFTFKKELTNETYAETSPTTSSPNLIIQDRLNDPPNTDFMLIELGAPSTPEERLFIGNSSQIDNQHIDVEIDVVNGLPPVQ